MSKLQQTFTEILRKKKRVIGVTEANQKRWRNGSASPTIKTMEKICTDNEIELPFFFDGQIENLIEYNKRIGEKMGFKIQVIF
jgi:transcriptional regulator with XRE-family HTH domain